MSDWGEAFVISRRYGMGDPLARSSPVGKQGSSQLSAQAVLAPRNLVPMSEDREQWRGEASPPRFFGGLHPSVTP